MYNKYQNTQEAYDDLMSLKTVEEVDQFFNQWEVEAKAFLFNERDLHVIEAMKKQKMLFVEAIGIRREIVLGIAPTKPALPATKKHRPEVLLAEGEFIQDSAWPTLLDLPAVGEHPEELVTFVKFEKGCFEQRLEKRMLRWNEHPRIWKVVQTRIEKSESLPPQSRPLGVLIKGHPGIGKTLTLDFLLSWSLSSQPNRPVIVVSTNSFYVFFVSPEGARERYRAPMKSTSVGAFLSLLVEKLCVPKGSTILVLHDLKTVDSLPYQSGLITMLHESKFNVVCVVASSPKESNFALFEKETFVCTYCVPVLSYEEACAFTSVVRSGETDFLVENDYFKVGGVPRYLCSAEAMTNAYDKQQLALGTLKWENTSNPFFDATFDDTNKLLCPIPSEDRTKIIVFDFISSAVRKSWLERSAGAAVQGLLAKLRKAATRDVYGRLYKQAVVERLKLKDGVTLAIQRMPKGGKKTPVSNVSSFKLEGSSKMTVSTFFGTSASVISRPNMDTLYLPQTCNFPVVDALHVTPCGNVTLFQVTVADTHRPSGASVAKLFRELKDNGLKVQSFIWVVDGGSKLKTKQQQEKGNPPCICEEYNTIEHYRCCFDFVIENETLTASPGAQ